MDNRLHNNGNSGLHNDNPLSDGAILLMPVFPEGSFVYVKTDPDQVKRIVTGFEYRLGRLIYLVNYMQHEFKFYEYELTSESDGNIKMGINK